jgi:hypothetical protein
VSEREINVWSVVYTDQPQIVGGTVVASGVLIERVRPC